jgi:fucose permease
LRFEEPLCFYAIFFLSGVNTVMFSLLLPHLKGLQDRQIGALLAAQFTGQLLGPLMVSKRPRVSLVFGLAGSTVAAFFLGLSRTLSPELLVIYGAALGVAMASTNTLVGIESSPIRREARIQMLNVFWPLGAASTPFFLSWLKSPNSHAFLIASATSFISLLLVLASRVPGVKLRKDPDCRYSSTRKIGAELGWACLMAALAGGIEFAIASWAPTLAYRYVGSLRAASAASMLFWAGILGSRLVTSYALRRVRSKMLAISAIFLTVVGSLMLAFAGLWWILPAVMISAVGIAPVYPGVIAASVKKRGKNLIFVSAGIGGACVPWLIGRISGQIGTLRQDMLIVTTACLLLALLLFRSLDQQTRSRAQPADLSETEDRR